MEALTVTAILFDKYEYHFIALYIFLRLDISHNSALPKLAQAQHK